MSVLMDKLLDQINKNNIMGMTITEKIMARQSGKEKVVPGELVWVDVESVMTMDYLGKQCFTKFRSLGKTEVFNKDKVICVSDHLVPPPNQRFANMLNEWREVVKEHDITYFYDLGRQGIAHQIMVEEGHVLPGTISIGTDSHANTYGASGAVGNAVGVTDAAVAMATGKAWMPSCYCPFSFFLQVFKLKKPNYLCSLPGWGSRNSVRRPTARVDSLDRWPSWCLANTVGTAPCRLQ